jgi:uncharacterized protein (TIGR03067 family)
VKLRALIAGLAVFLLAGDNAKEDGKKELKKFEGTWQAVSVENDGVKAPDDELKILKITIDGDKYTVKSEDNVVSRGTFKVDPSKKPKTIDITHSEGDGSGQGMLGIYEFDGDTMKACYARPGEARPAKFSADAGSGNQLIVCKKVKR